MQIPNLGFPLVFHDFPSFSHKAIPQWIGLRQNLRETPIINRKIDGNWWFLVGFPFKVSIESEEMSPCSKGMVQGARSKPAQPLYTVTMCVFFSRKFQPQTHPCTCGGSLQTAQFQNPVKSRCRFRCSQDIIYRFRIELVFAIYSQCDRNQLLHLLDMNIISQLWCEKWSR